MARKIKIDNTIIKRRSRDEKKRPIGFKAKRLFYLIVCEGEKTEPNYFSSLKKSISKGVLELTQINIDGTGKKRYKYKKNSIEMFDLLNRFGSQEFAISNAEKLETIYNDKSYSNHNPCTKVHRLIKELKKLMVD